jgi:hypothetical protein
VSGIVKQARSLNAINAITGVLAFDGECFVQLVEGPADAVAMLCSALARDPRHTGFTVHARGSSDSAQRRFNDWQMGYADVAADTLDIPTLSKLDGDAALSYFMEKVQALDFA